ncbi:MAG: endonuclease/exonuclease/phosphatase family protein [Calditrichae bacterium]|nr:endonuclease/exonuclease/phosphatase family protein [Calditrichota bacterium]MCB9058273.1 endonuclease/exonuclease/phosphatase family protein [Calditrichia bacterium]
MISKLKIMFLALLLTSFVISCSEDDGTGNEDPDPNGEETLLTELGSSEANGTIKVMTRNIYIGADVDGLLSEDVTINQIPSLVALAYKSLQDADFEERAKGIADEIEKTKPHLIGLQEVSKIFTQTPSDFLGGNPVKAQNVVYDYLEILLNELNSRGLNYSAVSTVDNADIELPMLASPLDDIRLLDRDVILARNDVTVSDELSENFEAMLIADTTFGLVVPRGFTSVKATVGGNTYRFINTHLEAFDPNNQLRQAQLSELLATFSDETSPVIMVGDFNSPAPSGPTYMAVTAAGFSDTWLNNALTYNENGYTYGHDADLMNNSVNFYSRIDFIFVKSSSSFQVGNAFVIGDELRDRVTGGLWPSDHGGVVELIDFMP